MKDLGLISTSIGIEVKQHCVKKETTLSQENYLKNVLKRYGMSDCKPASTPTDKNFDCKIIVSNDKTVSDKALEGTLNYKLVYKCNNEALVGFCDADGGGDVKDRKSTSGYCFKVFDCLVTWCSRKQACVSLLSTESECGFKRPHWTTRPQAAGLRDILTKGIQPTEMPISQHPEEIRRYQVDQREAGNLQII
ncbi:uncharacterized protein [Prorops nasuta]|uniref:uncharacterized protein n=1 Tax=Prorops nasuta TaxID=863751 RepID=UPI0034CD4E2F